MIVQIFRAKAHRVADDLELDIATRPHIAFCEQDAHLYDLTDFVTGPYFKVWGTGYEMVRDRYTWELKSLPVRKGFGGPIYTELSDALSLRKVCDSREEGLVLVELPDYVPEALKGFRYMHGFVIDGEISLLDFPKFDPLPHAPIPLGHDRHSYEVRQALKALPPRLHAA